MPMRVGAKTPSTVSPKTPDIQAARKQLTSLATQATAQAIVEKKPDYPVLEKFGEGLGLSLGVIVTEALAVSKSWNAPVLDTKGKPVKSVPGATRIGDYDIKKRHEEVVGPKIEALVAKMKPGMVHDLLDGMGKGATEAPGASYRLEAKLR